jgi:thioredoxin reductase (NADPH)
MGFGLSPKPEKSEKIMYDCVIIGAGPAGMTAALYLLRSNKTVAIIEKNSFGGKIALAHNVENYPGKKKMSGIEFSDELLEQITEAGCEFFFDEAVSIEKDGGDFSIKCLDDTLTAKTVIIAVGTENRPLGVEDEEKFIGKGVSYCALCDGAFYKDKNIAVIGGGNTAVGDAIMLSEIANTVYLIHRRNEFRAESTVVDLLKSKENIKIITPAKVTELIGEDKLSEIVIDKDGTTQNLKVDGVFVAIGLISALTPFGESIALDSSGYADSGEDCLTNTPGIFVAGDCRKKSVRQLTTAVSDGTVAAVAAYEYLQSL